MKKITERLIKLSAYMSLILGIIVSFGMLLTIVLLVSSGEQLNLSKLFLTVMAIIIFAFIIFFFFFGIYELLKHFVKIEKDVEKLEQKVGLSEDLTQKEDDNGTV